MSPHLLAHHGLFPYRSVAATELFRPRHAQHVALGERAAELLSHLEVCRVIGEGAQEAIRHTGFDEGAQIAAQLRGFRSHLEVHWRSYPEPSAGSMSAWPRPSSLSTSAVSAPSSGAGPATRPGVRENQVGTPGNRTGPCGVSTVSNKPTALRCGLSNSASGVFSGAAGISSSRNNANHSAVVRSFMVSATSP